MKRLIEVPKLKSDELRPPDAGVLARCMIERAVVFALLLHLERAGFVASSVDDGGDDPEEAGATHAAVMEQVFAVDDARIYFRKSRQSELDSDSVYLVFGNDGWDAVCDWSWRKDDPDGFNAAMDAFDPEKVVVTGVIGVEIAEVPRHIDDDDENPPGPTRDANNRSPA